MRERAGALLGLALLASAAWAVEPAVEPAIEMARIGAKSSAGGDVVRLTLSTALAPAWSTANVGLFAVRSQGKQLALDAGAARGRELDVALPADRCSLLVADLGRPEDRGFSDSWRRSRRSVKAVLCPSIVDPAADLEARRRAAELFIARAGTRDEVRALANPATTRPGCDLPLRLYADGRPAPGVTAVAEGPGGVTNTGVSDAHGFAVVALPVAGAWRVWFETADDRIAELLFDVPKPAADGAVDGGAP